MRLIVIDVAYISFSNYCCGSHSDRLIIASSLESLLKKALHHRYNLPKNLIELKEIEHFMAIETQLDLAKFNEENRKWFWKGVTKFVTADILSYNPSSETFF
jgi:hypothetical protein